MTGPVRSMRFLMLETGEVAFFQIMMVKLLKMRLPKDGLHFVILQHFRNEISWIILRQNKIINERSRIDDYY